MSATQADHWRSVSSCSVHQQLRQACAGGGGGKPIPVHLGQHEGQKRFRGHGLVPPRQSAATRYLRS
eukprot:358532-Chlamydomonas_euryale.AAC.10